VSESNGECGTLRPKGPNIEARMAESGGWGSWEGSSQSPPHQPGGLGSTVSSPAGKGQSPSRHMVFIHSEYFRWSLVVVNL